MTHENEKEASNHECQHKDYCNIGQCLSLFLKLFKVIEGGLVDEVEKLVDHDNEKKGKQKVLSSKENANCHQLFLKPIEKCVSQYNIGKILFANVMQLIILLNS